MSSTIFGSVRSGYGDYGDRYGKYYPGTYIDDYPRHTMDRGDRRAYRRYTGDGYKQDGFDYVMTTEPFQPDSDYYIKEHKKPYYYKDNRLYRTLDPVKKYYDGSGNVTVTVIDGAGSQRGGKDYQRYTSGSSGSRRPSSGDGRLDGKEKFITKGEVEVGYLTEHLASFDIGEDSDPCQTNENIEAAIECLRGMHQDNAILPLRCYLTYKDEELQVLSDRELTVLEWIKLDDVNLVSAEVHQIDNYAQILLIQVKEVIHLFCPVGDLSADDLAKNIKERISKRRDRVDEDSRSDGGKSWEEDSRNNRLLLNDKSIKKEPDADFYDKYTMQLYGRAIRDYVARNDKELTVMSGERVEIQSTRGNWWLARTSNGNSGYVPSDVLESYVPSPAGLPRSAIPGERRRDSDTVSERGSVYSRGGRDYHDGRRDYDSRNDDRYDRRDRRNRDDRDGCRDSSRYDRNRDNQFGTQRGFPSSTGLGGIGSNFGTGFNNAGLGTGFGTVGPTTGFSTISSATGAGLFAPNTLRGNPIPLANQGLTGATLGTIGLATGASLGAQGLIGNPVGTTRLAGGRQLGGFPQTVPLGTPLNGAQLNNAQLNAALGRPNYRF